MRGGNDQTTDRSGNDPRARCTHPWRGPIARRHESRLVLIGTYIEHTTKDDQTKRDRLMKGLDAFLERDHDRAVFGLPPRPTVAPHGAT